MRRSNLGIALAVAGAGIAAMGRAVFGVENIYPIDADTVRGRAKEKREAKDYNRLVNSSFADVKVTPRPAGSFEYGTTGESRQVQRAQTRRAMDHVDAQAAKKKRAAAGRAKLTRQTAREKSGFYAGQMAVEAALKHGGAGRLRTGDFK